MRPEYEKELIALQTRMQKAEIFAKKVPVFANVILERKLTGEETEATYGERYKQIPLSWGIKRLKKECDWRTCELRKCGEKFLWRIYINLPSLFEISANFGLSTSISESCYVHFDWLNTTFFATDEQIGNLLEELNEWYMKARKEVSKLMKQRKIEELEKELNNLKKEVCDV